MTVVDPVQTAERFQTYIRRAADRRSILLAIEAVSEGRMNYTIRAFADPPDLTQAVADAEACAYAWLSGGILGLETFLQSMPDVFERS